MRLAELAHPVHGTLRIDDGERVVLLGPSGAGKTVIVRELLALGERITGRRRRRVPQHVAYVPQSDGVLLDLTVLQNLCSPHRALAGIPEDRARDWLDLVGMSALAEAPTSVLSVSDRRRVALARALGLERPLLVIDGDLDPTLGRLLPDLLRVVPHLCSVLTTACTADEWVRTADSVAVVHDNAVVAQAPWDVLLQQNDPFVRSCLTWTMP
ncbi:ATP-binding cassette domain-containing protein [Nocardioides sp.]|uniref:ATP-binding cassette domain-containing protein n=1 Tax=Nocardioides sp. TaxID=35761 RepID=UPI0035171492